MTCPHVTITEDVANDITVTEDVAVDPTVTGDNFALSISGTPGTCCAEGVLRVGVLYNGVWPHSNLINFDATVG